MKYFIFILFSGFYASAEHREHGAHKHGAAELSIAFEGATGQIDFGVPSESIYGFEYVPKKDGDKKKQRDGLNSVEKNISIMIQFDPSLHCVLSKEKIEVEQHKGENHANVDAEFKVVCEKSPVGTNVTFNIQQIFPKIKDVKVKIIADDLQKSFDANKSGAVLELKK